MATSKNPRIQKLMDEVDALEDDDKQLEEKLQKIAEAVAAELQKNKPAITKVPEKDIPSDPQDTFACEGCQ